MKETHLYEQLAQYMNLQYPNALYHFDLSGVNNPSPYSRALYGKLNKRAWPDMFIATIGAGVPGSLNEWHYGLFLELKKEGTVIYKKDGTLRANSHQIEQALVLKALESQGYKAVFAVGFEQAKQLIDNYLNIGGR